MLEFFKSWPQWLSVTFFYLLALWCSYNLMKMNCPGMPYREFKYGDNMKVPFYIIYGGAFIWSIYMMLLLS